jgi:hypothetical protein
VSHLLPDGIVIDAPLLEGWLQCERRAWLQVHAPEASSGPDGLARHLAKQRADLRVPFQQALGRGTDPALTPPPILERVRRTAEAQRRDASLLFDPAFEVSWIAPLPSRTIPSPLRVLGTVDALRRTDLGWELVALTTGARIRDHHLRRLALASLAAVEQHARIDRATVVHVDRQGRRSAPHSLLAAADVTDACFEQRGRLPHRLEALAASLAARQEPATAIGSHCSRPRRCPFMERCWGPAPSRHLERVGSLRTVTRRAWRSAGWRTVDDVPGDVPGLAPEERDAVGDARSHHVRIERGILNAALAELRFPVAYLDIEFATSAVPLLDDSAPFEALPFQFSVHVEDRDGSIRHAEQLAGDLSADPRPALADALADILSSAQRIVVYDDSAERALLRVLRGHAGERAAAHLREAADHLWDLLAVLQRTVRHPGLGAGWDLKTVASTLAPASYHGVTLADGLSAQATWRTLLRTGAPTAREALRHYCAADSHAMLEIVRVLRSWARDTPGPSEGSPGLRYRPAP